MAEFDLEERVQHQHEWQLVAGSSPVELVVDPAAGELDLAELHGVHVRNEMPDAEVDVAQRVVYASHGERTEVSVVCGGALQGQTAPAIYRHTPGFDREERTVKVELGLADSVEPEVGPDAV